ncbi:hypothetical protein SOVF_059930 [Spinacia oleracea]|nr:hypothetical protein SOVF_059930 [Spinacia oleracea]
MAVVYWYSVVSVAIVLTASLVATVYVLWKKNQTQSQPHSAAATAAIEQRKKNWLYETLLFIHHHHIHGFPSDDSTTVFWTSCWIALHPAYLLAFRLFSFFTLAFFLSWDIRHWGTSIFIYYTEWTYSLTMLYFAIGSVISAHGCWLLHTQHNKNHSHNSLLESTERGDLEDNPIKILRNKYKPGFWGNLMQISYQISAGAVILTDIIFWCIIVPFISNARLGLTLLMGCIHTVNVAFLLLDTLINRLPFPWFRISYFVLWSSAYVIFQWLIHLCGVTWWPYPFLKLSRPLSPVWYLVLAVCHIACYGIYALIVKLKDSVFSKLFPHSYIRSD